MPFPVPPPVTTVLDRVNAFVTTAFNEGDMDRLVETYHSDAKLLPAGEPVIQGQPNLVHSFQTVNAAEGAHHVRLAVTHRHAYDGSDAPDGVFELGTYTFYTADEAVIDHGKFISLYHKCADGSPWTYKYAYDMFSSNMKE